MPYKNASSTYKETKIKTAGQGHLIVMLYDEAVKQLNKAVELLELNNSDKKDRLFVVSNFIFVIFLQPWR